MLNSFTRIKYEARLVLLHSASLRYRRSRKLTKLKTENQQQIAAIANSVGNNSNNSGVGGGGGDDGKENTHKNTFIYPIPFVSWFIFLCVPLSSSFFCQYYDRAEWVKENCIW